MKIMRNLQKKMQDALAEQAYLCYKFGWHQGTVERKAKLSKKKFFAGIKQVIESGKRVADGYDSDELFPEGHEDPLKNKKSDILF